MGEVHFRSDPSGGSAEPTTFITDRPTFEEPLEDLVQQASTAGDYPRLPEFVRAWNEQRGWTEDEGGLVSAFDLLTTARAVLREARRNVVDVEVWTDLEGFARRLLDHGDDEVWAVDA